MFFEGREACCDNRLEALAEFVSGRYSLSAF